MRHTRSRTDDRGHRASALPSILKNLPAIILPVLFLVLSTANMLIYRGGHATEYLGTAYDFGALLRGYDAGRLRYSFLLNFVSDLGRVTTYGGGSNLASASLFCLTLLSAGLGFFFSFRGLSIPGLPRAADQKLARPARILGQTSALAFAGLGFAPLDGSALTFAMHMVFVNVGFGSVMGLCILMTILLGRTGAYPRACAGAYLALFALLALFMAVMLYWGMTRTVAGYLALTVGQKIVVYLLVGNLLLQGIVTMRLSTKEGR
jgi:hypothetical protein